MMSLATSMRTDPAVVARFDALASSAGQVDTGGDRAAVLLQLSERPEFRPLLYDVTLRACGDLEHPFRVTHGRCIEIATRSLAVPALATLHLRHALEVAFWQRTSTSLDPAHKLARALLAAHTALVYMDTMPRTERQALLNAAPPWLAALASQSGQWADDVAGRRAKAAALARHSAHLLPLQGDDVDGFSPDAIAERACALAVSVFPFAIPTEYGLNLGGDSRLLVDPDTRLNGYGCSPSPRPWAITFCSCTASSTSDLAYEEAERARQAILARTLTGQALVPVFEEAVEQTRNELAAYLGLDSAASAQIIFCSSGTDCELFAVQLALDTQPRALVNVVIAPDEIGSGSMPAARGFHFDRIAPLGRAVEPGTSLDGMDSDRVRVVTLPVRDETGTLVSLDTIERQLHEVCTDALARGEAVLIHLLDSSKTGVRAPARDAVGRMRALDPSSVFVLVDAAQMRIDNAGIAGYLEQGFMVMISGSKFYTGSPFSGALLVPPALAGAFEQRGDLPRGFRDYASRFELPPLWQRLRACLEPRPNVGLFLRWRTALWEMQAYQAVRDDDRCRYFEAFVRGLRSTIAECPHAELLEAPVGDRRAREEACTWDALQTIFTFVVYREDRATGRRTPLEYDDARLVYFWLNQDISAGLPAAASEADKALAAKCCHIGQPVRIRRGGTAMLGALRIAVGARYVSRVAFDPTLGPDVTARIAAQLDDVDVVLRKIGLILAHWDALRG